MAEQEAKGAEFEKAAEKKMRGWAFWGYKYDDAADLFEKAANSYKLGKFWDKAGLAYIKRADCHLKLESKHEAASAYVDAANCYKKINIQDALRCLILAVNHFMEIGRLSTAAKHNKDIGEIYENEQDFEKAMEFFERAADLFQGEEVNSTANQCRLKVAQFASQLELYPKAIEIFEYVAKESINNNLLKYNVKGYLLNAGLCQICRGDMMALNNALEKYQELDPTFSGTRECKFLADLVVSIDEEDVEKFTDVVKEFDSLTRLRTHVRKGAALGVHHWRVWYRPGLQIGSNQHHKLSVQPWSRRRPVLEDYRPSLRVIFSCLQQRFWSSLKSFIIADRTALDHS